MKKHPFRVCVVLAVSVTLVVVACTITQKHGPGVYFYETYVEIYPGTKISSDDQKALNGVLKHFDKSIYKIKTYDRGKLVETQGSLSELEIDYILLTEIKKASLEGVSHFADQLGNPSRVASAPSGVGHKVPSPPPLETKNQDSKRLVRLVTPILLKYSHDQMASVVKSAGQ